MLCRNSAHAWYRKLSRGFVQPFRCLNFIQVFWWSLYSGGYWNIFQNKKEIQGLSHSIVMSPIPLYYLSHSAGNTFLTKVFDFLSQFLHQKHKGERIWLFITNVYTKNTEVKVFHYLWDFSKKGFQRWTKRTNSQSRSNCICPDFLRTPQSNGHWNFTDFLRTAYSLC